MQDDDLGAMSDSDLDAALLDLGDDDTADVIEETAEATTAEAETETTEEVTETTEAQEEAKAKDTDGPGDKTIALRQERERRRQAEERLAQYEAQQQQARQQHAEAQSLAELRAQLEQTFDPDEQVALVQRFQQSQAQQAQAAAQHQAYQARLNDAIEVTREANPDFDEVMSAAMQDPELAPLLEMTAYRAAQGGKANPALAAYKLAKKLSPNTRSAEIEAAKKEATASALAKQKAPVKGHTTIGHVSSATQAKPLEKNPVDMSDDELEQALRA